MLRSGNALLALVRLLGLGKANQIVRRDANGTATRAVKVRYKEECDGDDNWNDQKCVPVSFVSTIAKQNR